jgi:hypothetical protein
MAERYDAETIVSGVEQGLACGQYRSRNVSMVVSGTRDVEPNAPTDRGGNRALTIFCRGVPKQRPPEEAQRPSDPECKTVNGRKCVVRRKVNELPAIYRARSDGALQQLRHVPTGLDLSQGS